MRLFTALEPVTRVLGMASQFDDSDFIDREYLASQTGYARTAASMVQRPPTVEQLDSRVGDARQKLADLKRAQEQLERERAALEEARRRRLEFQTGREEMLQNLTRGVTLLEQAELASRRDAEQMAKTLASLRESLGQVQGIQDQAWTQENWSVELSKALATVDNARMEWNGARLKWALLNGPATEPAQGERVPPLAAAWTNSSFLELCKLGAALTWPVALVGLIGLIVLLVVRLR